MKQLKTNEKFVIYFGFPSTYDQIENVEKFAAKTNQSLENAWIDLLHSFMEQYSPSEEGGLFIPTVFAEAYGMQVVPPLYEQQKYPETIGNTTFKLPALSFKDDFVKCKQSGKRIKIEDKYLELICNRFKIWIDVNEVSYLWL